MERSQLTKLLSSDDFNHQRGVAMSITITISAVQSRTLDVMQMRCRTVTVYRHWDGSLWATTTLVADEAPRTLCIFSLTGTIFLLIRSHFARIQSSRSQYFTSIDHLSCGFYLNFFWRFASKASIYPSDLFWLVPRLWRHTPRLIVMHVVFRSLLKIFEYATKQACKQLQWIRPNYQSQPQIWASYT